MSASKAVDGYRRVQADSSTPLELVVMLYDGALRFLADARAAIERKDIRRRRTAMANVFSIIGQLQMTLDLERGGDVARELDRLYRYLTGRLLDAVMHNETAAIDDAQRIVIDLRDAWHTLASNNTTGRHQ